MHGKLLALQGVLADIAQHGVDQIAPALAAGCMPGRG